MRKRPAQILTATIVAVAALLFEASMLTANNVTTSDALGLTGLILLFTVLIGTMFVMMVGDLVD